MRAPLKRLAATSLALAPQGRFDRCLFLVGHMRCGSTALANVLCAHPSVSGYGETHVRYDRPSAPGALTSREADTRTRHDCDGEKVADRRGLNSACT